MAKDKSIAKADLINTIADETQLTKKDVRTVVDLMLDKISSHLNDGSKVQLTGFGTFEVRERQARTGVRPGTTDKIEIPASKYPAFRPGKALKDNISSEA